MDTLISIQNNKDTLKFYRAQDKVISYYLSLTSTDLIFDKVLKAGVSSDIFKIKFNLKSIPDILVVQELEGTFRNTFYFNQERTKLVKIKIELDLD